MPKQMYDNGKWDLICPKYQSCCWSVGRWYNTGAASHPHEHGQMLSKNTQVSAENPPTQLIGVQACQCVAELMGESTAGITKGSLYTPAKMTELSLQQLQSRPANDWHYCFARSQSSGSMVLSRMAFKGHLKTCLVISSARDAFMEDKAGLQTQKYITLLGAWVRV